MRAYINLIILILLEYFDRKYLKNYHNGEKRKKRKALL